MRELYETTWQQLSNYRRGETALIIGNGPSLKEIPLDFLKKYPSFGTNRIYLLDGFCPCSSYYVAINPLVIEQSVAQIQALPSLKFIRETHAAPFPDCWPLASLPYPTFSHEPARGVYEGHTVTYVCLQLAFYMGFKTVLLVGVDHRYQFDGQPNEERAATGADVNHFHPGYFSDGVKWHNPDLARSERAYRMAKTVYTHAGRKIINLTPGTALEVFEKGDYHAWL